MEILKERRWEHFSHGADIGVRGIGPTMAAAFEEAARALSAVIAEDLGAIALKDSVAVRCEAPDPELLLVDWLNALVYEMATRGMLFGAFTVRIEGGVLEAAARGEVIEVARHRPRVEVKGATMTELKVFEDERGLWTAQCVVDV